MFVLVSWSATDNPSVQQLVLNALQDPHPGKPKPVFSHELLVHDCCIAANFPSGSGGLPGILADRIDALRAQPGAPVFEYVIGQSPQGYAAYTSRTGEVRQKLKAIVNRKAK